jgi:hypothetical protein
LALRCLAFALIFTGALAWFPAHADTVVAATLAPVANVTLGDLMPYFAAAVTIATVIMRALPAPTAASSQAYVFVYSVLHLVAHLRAPTTVDGVVSASPSAGPSPGVTASALLALVLAAGLLSACTADQVAKACEADRRLQPVAVVLAPAAGATGAQLAEEDITVLHPAVSALCGDPAPAPAK